MLTSLFLLFAEDPPPAPADPGSGGIQQYFGYLLPIVFGTMTKQYGVTGLTGSTVSALFAEQRTNIANALPAGMSVQQIPGIGKTAGSNLGWLLALLLIVALAAAGYWYFIWRPAQQPGQPKQGPAIAAPAQK